MLFIKKNRSLFIVIPTFLVLVFLLVLLSGFCSQPITAQADSSYQKFYKSIKIENGDTLTEIANLYCNQDCDDLSQYIDEVISINHLLNGDDISAGEYLTIPYYKYTVL